MHDSELQLYSTNTTELAENSLLFHDSELPLHMINSNSLIAVVEDQVVISLGVIQRVNIDSTEIIFSTSKMVFELCSGLGGITANDEKHVKEVIEEILFKYRDRYKALADGKRVQASCDSSNSGESKEKEEENEEVTSGEQLVVNGV